MTIQLQPNIADADAFYAALVAAHEGLDEAASAELNARLVFLLANQVGDSAVLLECIAEAVRCGAATPAPASGNG